MIVGSQAEWRAPRPQPTRPFLCRAPGCGREMGVTDGKKLYLTACIVARPVELHCRHCGRRTHWGPDRATED